MSRALSELTQVDAKELITYYMITGKAFWNYRDIKWFKNGKKQSAQWNCKAWNAKNAGKEITTTNSDGYCYPGLLGGHVLLHRLIWLYQTGEWPETQIDHINGITGDNRWINLRKVTNQENLRNQKRSKSNTSGVVGVTWDKSRHKWVSQIVIGDKHLFLGRFSTFEEAVEARKAAEIKYNFHPNHGRD